MMKSVLTKYPTLKAGTLRGAVLALLAATTLSGCFTGIESTPKITEKDVRKADVSVTPEQEFATTLLPPPAAEWSEGRLFRVADSRISMLFEREPAILAGDTLVYLGAEQGLSVAADTISILEFTSSRFGDNILRMPLRVNLSAGSAAVRSIPFAVDLSMIENAAEKMVGNSYYIVTRLRVDRQGRSIAPGLRYISAVIDGVTPGTDIYPLIVSLTDARGNRTHIAMTAGLDYASTRNFDNIFSFSDPRLRHPSIAAPVWERIINGTVAAGMTTEECRLSLGSPRDVKKGQNGGSYFERWTFDNGSYLIFEDGLLSEFRL